MAGYKYNYDSGDPAEYSNVPFADSVNGTNGANSAGALTNQIAQKPQGGKSDPYQTFAQWGQQQAAKAAALAQSLRLKHQGGGFNRVPPVQGPPGAGYPQPPTVPIGVVNPGRWTTPPVPPTVPIGGFNPGAPRPVQGPPGAGYPQPPTTPIGGVNPGAPMPPTGPGSAPPSEPPSQWTQPPPAAPTQPPATESAVGHPLAAASSATLPPPETDRIRPVDPPANTNPDPAHIPDATWGQVLQWAQSPGYEWLAQGTQGAQLVDAYLKDAMQLAGSGAGNTPYEFADWLQFQMQHNYNLHGLSNPDFMKNAGYDTYKFASQDDYKNGITRDMRAAGTYPGGPHDPNPPQQPPRLPPSNGITPVNPPPPPPGTGTTPPPTGTTTPPPTGTTTPPPTGTGTTTPPPTGTGTTPPPATGSGAPIVPLLSEDPFGSINKYYNPLFQQQQDELARALRAQGALTGDINAGGFVDSLGRSEGQLINQQGVQKSEAIQKAQELGIQKYQIDADLFSKQMADATTRYGINTNADLQKWLDQNDNELKKYGIDKGDLLDRYKADLQLKGQEYSASAGVQAASLQAAAQQAASQANLQASKYATDVAAGTAANRQNFDWAQLQADLYSGDQNRMVQWANILQNAGITPAELMQILSTFGPSPPIFSQPTGGH